MHKSQYLWAFPGFEGCAGQGGSYQVTTKNKVFLEYIFHYFLIFFTNFIASMCIELHLEKSR